MLTRHAIPPDLGVYSGAPRARVLEFLPGRSRVRNDLNEGQQPGSALFSSTAVDQELTKGRMGGTNSRCEPVLPYQVRCQGKISSRILKAQSETVGAALKGRATLPPARGPPHPRRCCKRSTDFQFSGRDRLVESLRSTQRKPDGDASKSRHLALPFCCVPYQGLRTEQWIDWPPEEVGFNQKLYEIGVSKIDRVKRTFTGQADR